MFYDLVLLIGILLLAGLWLAMPNAFYTTVERHNDAVQAIELGATTAENEAQRAEWPEWLPSGLVNLGLDLRGGVHLLVEVQMEEVYAENYLELYRRVGDALGEASISRRVRASDTHVSIQIRKPEDLTRAGEILNQIPQVVTDGLGFATGITDFVVIPEDGGYRMEYTEQGLAQLTQRTMAKSLEIMRRRIDETGTPEPTIQFQPSTL